MAQRTITPRPVLDQDGNVQHYELQGDALQRKIPGPGVKNWHLLSIENWWKTIQQLFKLEHLYTTSKQQLDDLARDVRATAQPYDFNVFIPGAPTAGVTTLRAVMPPGRHAEIPSGGVGAVSCVAAPSAAVSLDVIVHGDRVGEVTIAPGQTRGQVIFYQDVVLRPYESLIIGPLQEEDATLEDVAIAIRSGALRDDELPESGSDCD